MCLLQETHSSAQNSGTWESEWGGRMYMVHGSTNARGAAICIGRRCSIQINNIKKGNNGRVILINMEIEGVEVTVCNIYAPNEDNPNFFKHTLEWIDKESGGHVIIAGDLNMVMDKTLDADGRGKNNDKAAKVLQNYIEENGLCDWWRTQHDTDRRYTWFRRKPTLVKSRLDYIIGNTGLYNMLEHTDIVKTTLSDHAMVTATLMLSQVDRGPGNWRFNNKLLEIDDFREKMLQMIMHWNEIYAHLEVMERWEVVKHEIIVFSQNYSKMTAKNKMEGEAKVYALYDHLSGVMDNEGDMATLEALNDIEHRITEIEMEQAEATAFRARAKWIREGEKNTRYFLALEKRNYTAKTLTKLKIGENVITNQTEILLELQKFYEVLYTSNLEITFNITNHSGIKVTTDQNAMLASQININELKSALDSMKKDRAPGCDGLTVNFFQTFWCGLQFILFEVYNTAIKIGQLNSSAKKGLITLIPKKADPHYIKNWRPLTMLNTDYKILAKLLALRLKKVLADIIGPQQTGFMEGRCISHNIRKTIDIVSHIYNAGKKALLVSIDYVKCFDRIEYTAVRGALRYFGINEDYINMTSLFFTDFQVCVGASGHHTDMFPKTRGVNQGCPLSPYLFLVCGEVMSHKIKENKNIRGIKLGEAEYVISQFADDTFLYLTFEELSLTAALETFAYIESHTGLSISYEKTTIYRVGSIRDTQAMYYTAKPMIWSSGDIELLGVTITNGPSQSANGYNKIIGKMETIANNWYHRNFTLMGKVIIVNSLMGSLFVYNMSVMPMFTSSQIEYIYKIIDNFIWKGRRPKIPRKILQLPKNKGGLGLIDIKRKHTAHVLAWIKFCTQEDYKYTHELCPEFGNLMWYLNLNAREANSIFSGEDYWSGVLRTWFEYSFAEPTPGEEFEQIIWYNSLIQVNGRSIFNRKALNAGLLRIVDLVCSDNAKWLSWNEFQDKFGPVMTWLEYSQLISAIPKHWIKTQASDYVMQNKLCAGDIIDAAKPVALIYKELFHQEDALLLPYLNRVNTIVRGTVTINEYTTCFCRIKKITNVVALRSFQYRMLLCKTFPKKQLYRWGFTDSPNCDYCETTVHSIRHLFWECPLARNVWESVIAWLLSIGEGLLTFQGIFLNDAVPINGLTNFIILVTKHYLYCCFCKGINPTVKGLNSVIRQHKKIECYNATIDGDKRKYTTKWQILNNCKLQEFLPSESGARDSVVGNGVCREPALSHGNDP